MIEENININIHTHTSHVWVILFFSLPKIEIAVAYLLQLELCLAGTQDPLWEYPGMLAWCLKSAISVAVYRYAGTKGPIPQVVHMPS